MRIAILAALVALPLLGAASPVNTTPVQAGSPLSNQCFLPSQVQNVRGLGGSVFLRVRVSEVFEARSEGCADQAFNQQLNLQTDAATVSDRLCVGDTARVTPLGSASLPTTCRISLVRKLSRADVSALPDAAQP